MNEYSYLDIEKEKIPYVFEVSLQGNTYEMEINYINEGDYFTVDLIKDNRVLIEGEKILYRKPLFTSILYKDIPNLSIIPYDLREEEKRITYENFYESIFLYLIEGDENGSV